MFVDMVRVKSMIRDPSVVSFLHRGRSVTFVSGK
jgi:hypothetical protein